MLTARPRWLGVCSTSVVCGLIASGCGGHGRPTRTVHPKTAPLITRRPTGRVPTIASIGAGGYAGYAVLGNGRVWAWGDDLEGQVGRGGARSLSTRPVPVPGVKDVVAIAGGTNTAYALQRGGAVWAWGDDAQDELGDSGGRGRERPTRVNVPGPAVSIAAGMFSAYALRRDGTVWAWGGNSVGQLGTSAVDVASGVPQRVGRLSGVVAIAAGASDGYALRNDGTVWAWGDDSLGQLGTGACRAGRAQGSSPGSSCRAVGSPVRVPGLDRVKAVAVGSNSAYALRRDGTVWAWGDNSFGALGTGARRLFVAEPARVRGLGSVRAIAAGAITGYAVGADGSVRSWGRGADGEIGDGSFTDRAVPTRLLGLTDAVQVAGGGAMGYALDRRGRLWAWGSGYYGQLGNGGRDSIPHPTLVQRLSPLAAGL
jgi:alpha-tubulin suppressor-like RCC1 family protein